jgi:uncharacterized protein DUF1552
MSHQPFIERRTFLRGLGTLVALPVLESLVPRAALAATAAGAAKSVPPRRMAILYVPNGAHMPDWTPKAAGSAFDLPEILEPLRPFRGDLLVLSGLTQDHARPHGDGPGDHARAAAAFLTGCQPQKTSIKVGISVDQVAASQVGQKTRFPSLELGCDRGQQAGNCDSGYSCAYSNNISWKSESTPMAKEIDPRLVFERLFGGGVSGEAVEARARREKAQKSVLDFIREDAARLRGRLGADDQKKLGEYFEGVREIEKRIEKAQASRDKPVKLPRFEKPDGIPRDYAEHIRLMGDLMVLAFQADLTRVATFMLANEGSNKSYAAIGVSEGHHELSHHGGDKEKQAKIKKINLFHLQQVAYILGKMRAVKEGGETLLDRSMVVYGSGISDGNAHNHDELPILVLGKAGGTLKTGRHIRYPKNTPLNNLYLSLLDRIDSKTETLGDSTGRLPFLHGEKDNF